MIVDVVIVLVLIAVNGLLAMSELAVVSARPSRLKAMANRGVRGSRRALALASNPGRFLSTVQIGITLIGILAGAFSGATIGDRLDDWLIKQGMPEDAAEFVAVGLVVTVITYLSLIAGELVPKQLALSRAEDIACLVAPAMTVLARVSFPLVWVLDQSSKVLLAILRHRKTSETRVTEEEIKMLVAEAESTGILTSEERSMIAGVMRLGDRPVRALMTPRLQIDYVDLTDEPAAIRRRLRQSPHSRLPACEGSLENVLGVVQAKQILDEHLEGKELDLRALVRSAPVIPDTMDALDVLAVLKESQVHMGLVHDEYGHFEGVVTPSDIMEAIVGEFRSEKASAEPDFVLRDDGSYLVAGAMPVDEFAEKADVFLPEKRDYHTVGGLLLSLFRKIPATGDVVEAHGFRFEIMDLDGRRIDKVLVTRIGRRSEAAG